MAKKSGKIEKNIGNPPPVSAVVSSYPQAPALKAEEYLTAYKGYVHTAISAIAHEIASIDLRLYRIHRTSRGVETEELQEHEALSLLHFANPFMTQYDLFEGTQIYSELVGEAFWVVLRDKGRDGKPGIPREAYLLRPDWMRIIPDEKEFIKEYLYTPGGNLGGKVSFPKENVLHFKYFNPTSPYRGRGSVQAGAMAIDIHNFAQDWNRNFFFNNAMPSAVFTTEKKYGKAVLDRFLEQWQNTYSGRKNSHKVAFLSGGFKLEKLGADSKQLDFVDQQRIMRDDILSVFKVPKTVLGLTDEVNKANAEATTRAFMERVITPRMKKFVNQLNEFYLPMFGEDNLFFDFTDPAPEDVELKLRTYENALTFGWMTVNEVRALENLEPLDGGDGLMMGTDEEGKAIMARAKMTPKTKRVKYLKPQILRQPKHLIMVPKKRMVELEKEKIASEIKGDVRQLVSELLKGEKKKPEQIEKDPKLEWTKEERDAFWRVFADRTEEREDSMKRMMRRLWNEEEEEVLRNLDLVKYYPKERRKGKESSSLPALADMVKRWTAVFIPFVREAVIEEGQGALDFLGVGGSLDMTTENVVRFIRRHGVTLVKEINKTTREKLRKTIAEGLEKEESISQIKSRVRNSFDMFRTSRAENIARSEVIRAANFATEEAFIQSDIVQEKEWLTSRDNRVCPWCDSLEGKRIKVGKPFFKKGESLRVEGNTLDFDLLDIDTPPLHPQCRCTLIAVIKD